jgi:GT2 family glycosyltransferase
VGQTLTSTPKATIVLPLDGAPEQALRCLASLSRLPEEPAHEVVIVDDASVGLEQLLARLDGDVAIARSPVRVGFAGAAALGAERAAGEVLVFLRGAPEVEPDWLAPLVGALEDPACAAAVSAVHGAPDLPAVAAHAIAARRTDLEGIGGVPAAPAGLEVAALCATLARRGSVDVVACSVVRPPGGRTGGARRMPGGDGLIELSIVIPTLDATCDRVRRCAAAVQATTDCAHEIVVIDNGAPPQGFTAPVNAGLRAARGRFMLVLNDDVELLPGWWPPLRAALEAGESVVFPLTIDGAMRRDFAAWCFALSRATLERFAVAPGEFLDPALVVWFQDTDLLDRLRAAGCPPVCVEASRIRHGLSETVDTEDPALRAWIREQVARDKQRYDATRVQARLDGTQAAA